jgi:hypothetical protein
MKRKYDEMTAQSVPGTALVPFVPATLAGVARSHLLDQAFGVAAAYDMGGAKYLNLDIGNTFQRETGSDLEQMFDRTCERNEVIGGHRGCVRVSEDRASIHWYLPDRLKVDLAAPDEKTLRAAVKDIPLAKLAELSAAK